MKRGKDSSSDSIRQAKLEDDWANMTLDEIGTFRIIFPLRRRAKAESVQEIL